MARNSIDLDQIQRRLGSGQTRQQPRYDDYGYEIPQAPAPEPQADKVSSGFVATVVASMIAVGSGTYFLSGGGLPSLDLGAGESSAAFVSASAPACERLWQDGKSNDAALTCYLTNNVKRLCNPQERAELSAFMKRYRTHQSQYFAAVNGAATRDFFKGVKQMSEQTKGVRNIVIEGAVARLKHGSIPEDQLKDMKARLKVEQENFDRYTSMPSRDAFDSRRAQIKASHDYEQAEVSHVRKIQTLLEAGYVSADDFGWSPDRFVKKAAAKAKPATGNPCAEG